MKKLLAITILSIFGAGAVMAQYASNGYYNSNRGDRGVNQHRGGDRYNARPGNHTRARGVVSNRGPRYNYGNNRGVGVNRGAVNRGGVNRGFVNQGCQQTRVVFQTCSTPGWRWRVTEGYFWVPGRYITQSCGMQVWQPGYYEWRVMNRNRVRYSAGCGW